MLEEHNKQMIYQEKTVVNIYSTDSEEQIK